MTPLRLLTLATLVSMAITIPGTASASYRAKAAEQTAFIQAHFYDPQAGLYRPSYPANPRELPYDFMWGNGVQLTALVGATRSDPKTYRPILYKFTNGLRKYWDEGTPIPCFDAYFAQPDSGEKYYDDNAWLVIGFAEAYGLTKDPMFLDWAKRTQRFVISGWDEKLDGGIYWKVDRTSKNTCSNAPAATGAMCLYRWTKDPLYLDWAQKIRAWTRAHLQDVDGLYWDNINLNGNVERTKWTYNTALMIRADVLLYEALKGRQFIDEARRSADAGIRAWVDPATGAIANTARFSHLFSEALLRLYDVTHDVKYLNVVRRHAAFGYRYVRDPQGGYWNRWERREHNPNERKQMIENASTARLFWLLAPYQDSDELLAAARKAAGKKDDARAEDLLRQAVASDDGALEARYNLWKVLTRERKTDEASRMAAALSEAAASSDSVRAQLAGFGWKAPK